MARRSVILLLLVLLSCAAHSQTNDDFRFITGRSAALGGIHRALNDDFSTLFANPAGLEGVDSGFVYSRLGFTATGPIFTIASIAAESLSGGDFVAILASPDVQTLLGSIYAQFTLGGPVYFGYTGGGMGFGVLNETQLTIQSIGAADLEIRVGERFLLRGGYSIPIGLPDSWDSELTVGLGVKGFVRGDSVIATSTITLPSLVDDFSPALLTDSPFELVTGIGLDVGLRYSWRDLLSAALTVDNLYSPVAVSSYTTLKGFLDSTEVVGSPSYEAIPQEFSLGFGFTPTLGSVGRYVRDLTLLLDYEDIFDFWLDPGNAENIILKFGIGAEATFLEVLAVRAGFSEGLYAAGIGVDLGITTLNASMYGTELSSEPGFRSTFNVLISLEFGG